MHKNCEELNLKLSLPNVVCRGELLQSVTCEATAVEHDVQVTTSVFPSGFAGETCRSRPM